MRRRVTVTLGEEYQIPLTEGHEYPSRRVSDTLGGGGLTRPARDASRGMAATKAAIYFALWPILTIFASV